MSDPAAGGRGAGDPTTAPPLVLLAAGRSTRFGRPKQLEPLGPGGASLLDYAVVDALRGGFGGVVVVTSPALRGELEAHVAEVLGPDLPLEWRLQELDGLPPGLTAPPDRDRPWGTAHAVLAAADALHGPFGVANADDWYGPEAYRALAAWLVGEQAAAISGADGGADGPDGPGLPGIGIEEGAATVPGGALVTWPMSATLSDHGGVSRGWVRARGGRVDEVVELRGVERAHAWSHSVRGRDPGGRRRVVPAEAPASMNLWGLPREAPGLLEEGFVAFLESHEDDPDAEYPLSTALDALVRRGRLRLTVIPEGRRWFGVTFADDRPGVEARLAELHDDGTYPTPLRDALA